MTVEILRLAMAEFAKEMRRVGAFYQPEDVDLESSIESIENSVATSAFLLFDSFEITFKWEDAE